jgi:hypothetical protein
VHVLIQKGYSLVPPKVFYTLTLGLSRWRGDFATLLPLGEGWHEGFHYKQLPKVQTPNIKSGLKRRVVIRAEKTGKIHHFKTHCKSNQCAGQSYF